MPNIATATATATASKYCLQALLVTEALPVKCAVPSWPL